jgi:hypothetical protein
MRKIGDKATGSVIERLRRLNSSALLTGSIRISNRKSGIRIHVKAQEISAIQIPNRKYFAIFDRSFCRFSRFLIYGSAIKTPRSTLKNVSHRNF